MDAAVDTEEKKEKFFDTFGGMCDKIFVENLAPIWPEYDELGDYFDLRKKALMTDSDIREVRVCPFPFYQMFIHSDGTVVPCCADWKQKLPMGNVKDSTVFEIWNGEVYRHLLIDMLKDGRQCRNLCSICSYPDSTANDNIDNYAEKILTNFNKRE